MDFTFPGGNDWGTDTITASTPLDYDSGDLFITQQKINKNLEWPVRGHNYPNPEMSRKFRLPDPNPSRQTIKESFISDNNTYPLLTENMLIILLLVVLIVMCTIIYSTVKQTCETMKLMVAMLSR